MPHGKRKAKSEKSKLAKLAKLQKKKDTPKAAPKIFTKWLMKSEPESRIENGVEMKFSFDDLKKEPNETTCWDGVRNYQARNFMRDQMKVGQSAFYYHSNCKEPGIVGITEIVKEGYVDHTQFDSKDPHFDKSSSKEDPKWIMVDVKYVRKLKRFISLKELKQIHLEHKTNGGPLEKLSLFTRARLSVQPLTEDEFKFILQLEEKDPDEELKEEKS
ncbi:thymocyte nuclear protein 1-like [Apostichopus japonicus]|uniref:thymocyte nuclear protein 1-like n=1 Tax=Stichopus japonicus TaxID=307972 RepID=UPI003AB2D34E